MPDSLKNERNSRANISKEICKICKRSECWTKL